MTTLERILVGAVCFSLSVAAAPAAAQESPTETEARSVFAAGGVAFSDGRYSAALGYFRHAYELSHRPALLFNIALCEDRLRDDDAAIADYERYIAAVPLAANRREVDDRLDALREARARRLAAARAVRPATVAQAVDATAAPHGGATEDRAAIDVTASTARTADPATGRRPEGAAIYETWWFWTIVGAVVVGGAVGVGIAASGDEPLESGDIGGVLFALGWGR